jgi:hypothetical protein
MASSISVDRCTVCNQPAAVISSFVQTTAAVRIKHSHVPHAARATYLSADFTWLAAGPAPFCRSSERHYFVSCAAPASSTACPGNPRWISVKAKSGQQGLPEGYNSTVIDGLSTVEFNVTTRCNYGSVYHGIVDFAYYRNLPLKACGK